MLFRGDKGIIFSLKTEWSLFISNHIPIIQRMLFTKFGSWEHYLKSLSIYFHYYLLMGKGMALHLNKHDFPSPKDALSQVTLKMALWFLRRRFLKLVNVFSLFPYYLPLEMGGVLNLNKLESPLLKNALC